MKTHIPAMAALAVVALSAHAADLAVYDFPSPNHPAATTVGSGLTASDFGAVGVTLDVNGPGEGSGSDKAARAHGWSATDNQSTCFTFTLTADPGKLLDLSSLSLDEFAGTHGPASFSLYVNGTAVVTGSATSASWASKSVTLTGFDNLSSAIISLCAYAPGNNGGDWNVDDVTITGSVTAVPEAQEYAAAAGLGLLSFGILRRSRRAI